MIDEKVLIERLEEYKYTHLVACDSERLEHCKENEKDCEGNDCFLCVWEKAIEIVKKLASEHNNGWIPCSERLPNKEEYLKDDGRFIVTDGNRRYQSIYDRYEGRFRTVKLFNNGGSVRGWDFEADNCVIAWQPLPAPYRKGE